MIKLKAYAKINLMLDILSRLDNGYHSLWMIMQSVGLFDEITLEKTDSEKIELSCSEASIPCDRRNIAYKCAEEFFKYSEIENCGIKIHIEKQIPAAAGLAGGSADGAGTLIALNEIFSAGLSQTQLCEIGIKVGADIPFCIVGGTCLAQDMGQVLSPLPDIPKCYIVLAKPTFEISTKDAYDRFDKHDHIRRPDKSNILHAAALGDFDTVCKYASNVFEQILEVPERVSIKSIMRSYNCKATLMSGSGPTVYGIFSDKEKAKKCANELTSIVDNVFICKPVSSGTEIIE